MMNSWGFGGGGFGGGAPRRRFEEQYHCYSVAAADKAHLEVSVAVLNEQCWIVYSNVHRYGSVLSTFVPLMDVIWRLPKLI